MKKNETTPVNGKLLNILDVYLDNKSEKDVIIIKRLNKIIEQNDTIINQNDRLVYWLQQTYQRLY